MHMKRIVSMILVYTMLLTTMVSPALAESVGVQTPSEAVKESTAESSQATIDDPTEESTQEPAAKPTEEPTQEPAAKPTEEPTQEPASEPTEEPAQELTAKPTEEPTQEPASEPTEEPTQEPTAKPTEEPTQEPTIEPTENPTVAAAFSPSYVLCRAGVRIYAHLAMKGEHVTLAEDGVIYAYDSVEYEGIEGYEVAYVTEEGTQRGFLRKESRSECISADRAQQYRNGQNYAVSGISGATLSPVVLKMKDDPEETAIPEAKEEPKAAIVPETTEEPKAAGQLEAANELETTMEPETMALFAMPMMLSQNEAVNMSETASETGVETDARVHITIAPTESYWGDKITLTVSAPGAEQMRLYYNGELDKTIDGDSLEEIWEVWEDFSLYATACFNGEWSKPSESVNLSLIWLGTLEAPAISVPETIEAGKDVPVSWTSVPNAKGYYLSVSRSDGSGERKGYWYSAEQTSAFVSGGLLDEGSYHIELSAEVEGWYSGVAEADFTVTGEKTAAPTVTVSATQVLLNQEVTFYISAPNADMLRMSREDHVYEEEFKAEGDSTEKKIWLYDVYDDSVKIAFSARINGVWSAYSEPVTIDVTKYGELEQTKLTAPQEIAAGIDLEASWTEVENAQRYAIFVRKIEDDGSTVYVTDRLLDASTLSTRMDSAFLEEGNYIVELNAYADGWETSSTEAQVRVSGEKAQGPAFSAEPTTVVSGYPVTFTIETPKATKIRMNRGSGYDIKEFDAQGDVTTIEEEFVSSYGETCEVSFSILVNGVWTAYGEAQSIEVTPRPKLEAAEVALSADEIYAGESFTVSWNAVEFTENYYMRIRTLEDQYVLSEYVDADQINVEIAAGELAEGEYKITVSADADGYSPSESAELPLHVLTPKEGHEYAYSLDDAGHAILKGYLGAQVPASLIIPSQVDEYPVTGLDYAFFKGNTTLEQVVIPAGITGISSTAFEGCDGLRIAGYTGSAAEKFALTYGFAFDYLDDGQAQFDVAWQEPVLINGETTFHMDIAGAEDVRIYINASENWFGSKELMENGATVTKTFSEAGETVVRFEALVDETWVSSKSYKLNVQSYGEMPVPELRASAQSVETGASITFEWDAIENTTGYHTGIQEPDSTYISWTNCGADTAMSYSGTSLTKKGVYTFWVEVQPAPGFEPSTASATFEVTTEKVFDYLPEQQAIIGYYGAETDVVIPSEIDGHPVTCIWNDAFKNSSITSVVIPEGVTEIRYNAFEGCGNLTKVTFPSTVKYLYDSAFQNCASLTEVSLPANLISIGYKAFANCAGLKKAVIPQGVGNISSSAFSGCTDLTIYGYTGSAAEAFATGHGIAFVKLDDADAGDTTFTLDRTEVYEHGRITLSVTAPNAEKLRVYVNDIPSDVEYSVEGGTVQVIEMTMPRLGENSVSVAQCVNGEWLIPCEAKTVLVKPLGVPEIQPINGIIKVGAELSVKWTPVEDAVYYYAMLITEDGVSLESTRIAGEADDLGFVTYVWSDTTLVTEGDYTLRVFAFAADGGYSEAELTFKVMPQTAFNFFVVNGGENGEIFITEYYGTQTNVIVPSEIGGVPVKYIYKEAFANSDITAIVLPESVEEISESAFSGCASLKKIVLPSGFRYIRKKAFYGCTSLREVALPSELNQIGSQAFAGCSGLTKVTIPLGVIHIEDDAFSGCENLEIWGYTGSEAERFANEQGFIFHALATKPEFTLSSYEIGVGEPAKLTLTNMAADQIRLSYTSDKGEGEETYFINGSEMWNCFFSEEGLYRVTVSCENGGVWSEPSDGQMVAVTAAKEPTGKAQKPSFTMELTGWGAIHFAIQAPGADIVQMYEDGALMDLYKELEDGTTGIYYYVDPGTYEFSFRAWQDGEWSEPCEAQSFEMPAEMEKLDMPVIHEIGDVRLSDDTWTFTWEAVPNAETYRVDVIRRDNDGTVQITGWNEREETSFSIWPSGSNYDFEEGVEYVLQVRACAEGYVQSDIAERTFTVQELLALNAPMIDPIENILLHQSMMLSWQPVENAECYDVKMWLESNPNSVVTIDNEAQAPSEYGYSATENLEQGTYIVQVTAKADGYKPGIATEKITIECLGTLEAPKLSMKDVLVLGEGNSYPANPVDISKVELADDYCFAIQLSATTIYYFAQDIESSDMGDFIRLYIPTYSNNELSVGDEVEVYAISCRDGYVYGKSASRTVKVVAEYEYEIVDGGAVITAYNGYGTSINVPSKLGGYPVTAIGNGAFEANTAITSVSLPESVTAIGARAFKNCTGLERIYGTGVTYIGAEAFSGCTNLIYVRFSDALTDIGKDAFENTGVVVTPNPLDITIDYSAELGEGQYANNPMLGSVHYAEGITVIPARTHYYNVNLGKVYLPSTLQTIGAQAFAADEHLGYVKLYDGITSIADDAFEGSLVTTFEIFVRELETVSYVEQYAIDHNIPYTKTLYADSAPEVPDVVVDGEGVEQQTETEFTVQVNRQVNLRVVGEAADKVIIYLDDEAIAEKEFLSGNVTLPYTFTETGDYHLYAISYNGNIASEKTLDKTVHVVGLTFSTDKEEAWTCENVHFDVSSSNLSGTVLFYADGEQFAEAVLENGQASVDYSFTKAGDRVIRVEVGSISSIERVVTVKSIERLAAPVVQAEAIQAYQVGLNISWNAVEHADGYVVRVINAGGETFYRADIKANGNNAQVFTIPAEQLQGAGSYAVFVMDYGYQYDQNESQAVSVMMVEEGGLMFAMDKTEVQTGEAVRFTVAAPGAESVKMMVDGEAYEIYALIDGSTAFERAFHQSGERQIAFRALRGGEWSEVCATQILTVTSAGKLEPAQIIVKAYHLLGSAVDVSWNAVEHADGYTLYALDANGAELYRKETQDKAISIPAEVFSSCGTVEIVVMAFGLGYDQSRSAAQTEIIAHLPGPVILTPVVDETLSAHTCMVTWEPVDGAQSYVITLARRTDAVDVNGEPVYEKVWTAPDEVINVGAACSYMLENLVYGEAYRVAVGAVLEGTGTEDASKVGWTERRFSVDVPSLDAKITLSQNTVYEKQEVTVTVTVNHAQSAVILSDGADVLTPVRDEATENSHIFEFIVNQNRQGIYSYTLTVKGTGDIEKAEWLEKSFTIEFLDADRPVISAVEMEPNPCWPEMDARFEITGNEFTEYVDVYLHKGSEQILLGSTAAEYDTLFGAPEKRIFSYVYRFAEAGEYTLHFTPHNSVNPAEDEYGDPFEQTFAVLPMGQLPNPVINNLKNGDILIDEENTVTWSPITTSNGMPFGGYCVLLEKKTDEGYALVPDYAYKSTGKTASCVLSGLDAGTEYRLHVFALEDGHTEPDGKLHGEAVVEFGYRTVPGFSLKSLTTDGTLCSPITATWTAPVWPGNVGQKPTNYVVWWYGPGLPYNEEINTNAKAFVLNGDVTSFTLDGNYTTVGGNYSVYVYAMLSLEEDERAQRKAEGFNQIEIAKPQIDSIWFNGEDKTEGRIVDIVDLGEMSKNMTFTVRVKGGVKAVKVFINGVLDKMLPVVNGFATINVPIYGGDISILEVCTEDGSSSQKAYIAMCEYLDDTIYIDLNGADYLLWPEEGEKLDGTFFAETELKLLGACNGYYFVDLGSKWRFVPKKQAIGHKHVWYRQLISGSVTFACEDSTYHRLLGYQYNEVCIKCNMNRYAHPLSYNELSTVKIKHTFQNTACKQMCSLCGLTQTHHTWKRAWNGEVVCTVCGMHEDESYFEILMNADKSEFNPMDDEGLVESLRNRIKNCYGVDDTRADMIIEKVKGADQIYRDLYLYSIYNYELSKNKRKNRNADGTAEYATFYSKDDNTLYLNDYTDEEAFLRTWFHESGHGLELSPYFSEKNSEGLNVEKMQEYRSKIHELVVKDVENTVRETISGILLYIREEMDDRWNGDIESVYSQYIDFCDWEEIDEERFVSLTKDIDTIVDQLMGYHEEVAADKSLYDDTSKLYKAVRAAINGKMPIISNTSGMENALMVRDLFGGVTGNAVGGGHPDNYWYDDDTGMLSSKINEEAWAEFFAAKITRCTYVGGESLDSINQDWFDETYPVLKCYANELRIQYKNMAAAKYK